MQPKKPKSWRISLRLHARENFNATAEVQKWVAGTSYQVVTVNTKDGDVEVTVAATGQMKPAQQLANQLAVALGQSVVVDLRTLPEQRVKSSNP